jgi:hypothetical protein
MKLPYFPPGLKFYMYRKINGKNKRNMGAFAADNLLAFDQVKNITDDEDMIYLELFEVPKDEFIKYIEHAEMTPGSNFVETIPEKYGWIKTDAGWIKIADGSTDPSSWELPGDWPEEDPEEEPGPGKAAGSK